MAAAVCALALAGAAGCSSGDGVPPVAFPSASAAASIGTVVQVTPAPSYTGYSPPLNAITAQITNIPSTATLVYPVTSQVTFTVTLTNTSTFAFRNIQPLVVMGQCTCNPTHYNISPRLQMQYWDTSTKLWTGMAAGDMSTGDTYSYALQTGPINLGAHATISYNYRMSLQNTRREPGLVNGTGSLTVYILQMPQRSRLSVGLQPDASVPLAYTFK
jgi:hypothetical protein